MSEEAQQPTDGEEQKTIADQVSEQFDAMKGSLFEGTVKEEDLLPPETDTKEGQEELPATAVSEETPQDDKGDKEKQGLLDTIKALRADVRDMKEKHQKDIEARQKEKEESDPWHNVTDDQIDQALVKWERALQVAVQGQDDEAADKAEQSILTLRTQQRLRLQKVAQPSKPDTKEDQATQFGNELGELRSRAIEAMPALKDNTSAVYQAAQKMFQQYQVMQHTPEIGEMIAIAMAIIENPELVSKTVTTNVVGKLAEASEKALRSTAGTGGGSKPKRPLTHKENIALAEEMKRGKVKGLFSQAV